MDEIYFWIILYIVFEIKYFSKAPLLSESSHANDEQQCPDSSVETIYFGQKKFLIWTRYIFFDRKYQS
jgi:hypothetical protein